MNDFDLKARKIAIWVIFGMIGIWIVLSIFSFTNSKERGRPDTQDVTFEGKTGLQGKQVFQAYNCMDCHTIVGNGAYFAPDLTKTYADAGPAWLKAFLASPGSYPTRAVVNIQFQQLQKDGQADAATFDEYLSKFKGAEKMITRQGGVDALMPNLRFTSDEISELIAFLKYTSKINTGGWPPKVIAKESVIEEVSRKLQQRSGLPAAEVPATSTSTENTSGQNTGSPISNGKAVATQMGCMACHSTDGSVKIGPSFKGLYGSVVTLSDGKTVHADTDYLKQSILQPNAEVVKGFPEKIMPSFDGIISEKQLSDIIAFIESQK